jgi:photosystem II stability/assembly factor-like uncharacterized protein
VVFVLIAMAAASSAWAASGESCWISNASVAGRGLWLLCQSDYIYLTTDQGATWTAKPIPEGGPFRAISFLTEQRGFLIGSKGTLLVTEDAASTWRKVEVPTNEHLVSIHFNGDRGWIGGYGGVILNSQDAGRTWTAQQSPTTKTIESIYFTDPDHGWAVGWTGTVMLTTNGGRDWKLIPLKDEFWTLSAVYFKDNNNGWIVGFQGRILNSNDGGLTWKVQQSPVTDWLTGVRFDAAGRGWIAADRSVLVSEDNGQSWRSFEIPDRIFVGQIEPAGDTLWGVGLLGLLQQSSKGPVAPVTVKVPRFTADNVTRIEPPKPTAPTSSPARGGARGGAQGGTRGATRGGAQGGTRGGGQGTLPQ